MCVFMRERGKREREKGKFLLICFRLLQVLYVDAYTDFNATGMYTV